MDAGNSSLDEISWASTNQQETSASSYDVIEIVDIPPKRQCTTWEDIQDVKKLRYDADDVALDNAQPQEPDPGQSDKDDSKGSNLLSLISIIAAKNAIASGGSTEEVSREVSESLAKNQWQLHLEPQYFSDLQEEDLISWTGQSSLSDVINTDAAPSTKKRRKATKPTSSTVMLNASRSLCAFVYSDTVQGKHKVTYYCNFCKLTESSYGGFYQHLNHHLFTCGQCAYHSSCRLDVEIHRERAKHMTPLALGYLAHKQHDHLVEKCSRSFVPEGGLVEWQTIREETEALIIIQSAGLPESAQEAHKRAHPDSDGPGNGSVSMVCALPYHRYVSQKSCRKNVLEYHCNFCQSTPIYTQELYRHIDFHAFTCKETDCTFQSFTNLELFLHQRNAHFSKYQSFLEKLVVFVPQSYTKEQDFVDMAVDGAAWTIVLNLPRSLSPDNTVSVHLLKKEREWRCKVCNNFVINKGGLTTHLVLLHNIKPKDVLLYMEPMT